MKHALYALSASILIAALALCWAVKTASPASPASPAAPEDPRAEICAQVRDMALARISATEMEYEQMKLQAGPGI